MYLVMYLLSVHKDHHVAVISPSFNVVVHSLMLETIVIGCDVHVCIKVPTNAKAFVAGMSHPICQTCVNNHHLVFNSSSSDLVL